MQVKNILENEVLKSNLGNYLKSYQLKILLLWLITAQDHQKKEGYKYGEC